MGKKIIDWMCLSILVLCNATMFFDVPQETQDILVYVGTTVIMCWWLTEIPKGLKNK